MTKSTLTGLSVMLALFLGGWAINNPSGDIQAFGGSGGTTTGGTTGGTGTFDALNANTITANVSATSPIYNANTVNANNVTAPTLNTNTINGNPNLALNANRLILQPTTILSWGTDASGGPTGPDIIILGNPNINNTAAGNNVVMIGDGSYVVGPGDRHAILGAKNYVLANAVRCSILGNNAGCAGDRGIAIGNGAGSGGPGFTGVGARSACIGNFTQCNGTDGGALGSLALNGNNFSWAFGAGAATTADHQLKFGTSAETSIFPGNVTLASTTVMSWGASNGSFTQSSDGNFLLSNNASTRAQLQLGAGVADQVGTVVLGTAGDGNALVFTKNGVFGNGAFKTGSGNINGVQMLTGQWAAQGASSIGFLGTGTGQGAQMGSTGFYNWASTASGTGTADTGLTRFVAGTVQFTNGGAGLGSAYLQDGNFAGNITANQNVTVLGTLTATGFAPSGDFTFPANVTANQNFIANGNTTFNGDVVFNANATFAKETVTGALTANSNVLVGNANTNYVQFNGGTKLLEATDGSLIITNSTNVATTPLLYLGAGPADVSSNCMKMAVSGGTWSVTRCNAGNMALQLNNDLTLTGSGRTVALRAGTGVGMSSTSFVNWSNSATEAGADVGLVRTGVSALRATNASTGFGSLAMGQTVVAKTANYTILPADVGTVFTNASAGGSFNFNLPACAQSAGGAAPAVGFVDVAAQSFTVTAAGSDTVTVPGLIQVTKTILTSPATGAGAIYLTCVNTGSWQPLASQTGAWTSN